MRHTLLMRTATPWILAGYVLMVSGTRVSAAYLDVVISELMYHAPAIDSEGEYVEITNRGAVAVDLTGWYFGDGIVYAFPAGTMMAAGDRLVIAKTPAMAAAIYGITGVLGPYEGRLNNGGERIDLRDANGGLVCEVDYNDDPPWPTGGDGDGRSIELTDLSKNHNVGRFWAPSAHVLGTPGAANVPGPTPPAPVVINEFLANSSGEDWIELYNHGTTTVDLNGYYLTDDPEQPAKAQITASWSAGTTIIPAKGYWTATQSDFGFGLGSFGEQVYLIAPDGVTWVDGYDFGDQPIEDATEGRYPDGDSDWVKMPNTSQGSSNLPPVVADVVINEIMYHPLGDSIHNPGTEYLELYNNSGASVDLEGWILKDAVSYTFPAGAILPPWGYVVIAANPTLVESTYGISGVLGPYAGRLSNFSEEIELEDWLDNPVNDVTYRQEGLWPIDPDGTGPSLELATLVMDNRLSGAWRTSSGNGTPGIANTQFVGNPAASISRVRHLPLVPTSSEAVTVTARAGAGNLTSVTLYYKRDPDGGFSSTSMYDDGLHGDRLAGDGLYGGTIPAGSNGTTMEFYIQANATGGNRSFPDSAPTNNCLYMVQDATPDSNLTFFRFVMTDENESELYAHNEPQYDYLHWDATFIYGDKAYYNCGIRFRGGGRGGPKYSYKLFLPPGYNFRGADRFNLNYEKNDETLLTNVLVYNFVRNMGLPSCETEWIHTRFRNNYAGVHYYAEAHNEDYLEDEFPDDSDGNMYKATSPWTTATAWRESHSRYEKETNEEVNDWSDFDNLGNVTSFEPNATYEQAVRQIVDTPNWGRSFAVLSVMCLIDTPWHFHNQNYRLYRRFSDNRFIHLLYDFDDAYWDTMYASAGPNASMFPDTNRYLEWPAFKREQHHGIWKALNLTDGVYREARMEPEYAYYYDLIYDDVSADPFSGSGDHWTQFVDGLNWWNGRAATRNTLLRGALPSAALAITTNNGQPMTTSSANLTLEGTAPIEAPRLEVFGAEDVVDWQTTTMWQAQLTLVNIDNTIVVRTLDDEGNEIESVSIDVTCTICDPNAPAFSADVTRGAPPLTVQFTDETTLAGVTAWFWEFGDGETSIDQHPSHMYTQEGQFTVRLTVTIPSGSESGERVDYIRAAHLPKVAMIAGQLPLTPADAAVQSHLESLDLAVDAYDDEPANRPTAVQIAADYDLVVGSSTLISANVAGEFRHQPIPFVYWESALSLTDRESLAEGPAITGGKTELNIVDNSHPITAGIPTGSVTVTDTGGDFSYSSGPIAPGAQTLATIEGYPDRRAILVAEPGALLLDGGVAAATRVFLYLYDTTWLSTNDTGKQILDNAVIYTLNLSPPSAQFSASVTTGTAPLTVQFTDESTGTATAWSWDFGDGEISSLRHPSHTYSAGGTYDVSLTVSGVGENDTLIETAYIVVDEGIPPDLDHDGDVDQSDFGMFQVCLTGPSMTPPSPGCEPADFDQDDDVDLADFGLLQRCMSGPEVPFDPACAD